METPLDIVAYPTDFAKSFYLISKASRRWDMYLLWFKFHPCLNFIGDI